MCMSLYNLEKELWKWEREKEKERCNHDNVTLSRIFYNAHITFISCKLYKLMFNSIFQDITFWIKLYNYTM